MKQENSKISNNYQLPHNWQPKDNDDQIRKYMISIFHNALTFMALLSNLILEYFAIETYISRFILE